MRACGADMALLRGIRAIQSALTSSLRRRSRIDARRVVKLDDECDGLGGSLSLGQVIGLRDTQSHRAERSLFGWCLARAVRAW
jgi:hypothetical protein